MRFGTGHVVLTRFLPMRIQTSYFLKVRLVPYFLMQAERVSMLQRTSLQIPRTTRMLRIIMTSSCIRILRVYLKMACLAALVIQMVMLLLIAFGRFSEGTFMTGSFQRIALVSICVFLAVLNRVGLVAYRYAVKNGDATLTHASSGWIVLTPTCRFRRFVDVYLGFSGLISIARVAAESPSIMQGLYVADEAPPWSRSRR